MARIYSCGFELQSVTSGVEWDTTTGSPTINTTTKRSGAASLNCAPTAATAYIQHQFRTAASSGDVFVRFYLYISTATDALDTILLLREAGGQGSASIRMNSNRTLELWEEDSPAQVGSDSSALNLNQWYRIELNFDYTGIEAYTITGYIDGTQFATGSVAAASFDAELPDNFRLGAVTATTANLYFDDVAVNDSTGTAQTGLPGAGSIVHMHPTAAGDAAATTGLFSAVDEITPNDVTDYIEQDTIAEVDYNFETSANAGIGASDTITLVQIGTRQRPETAAASGWQALAMSQSGGTTVYGNAKTHNDITWKTNGDVPPIIYSLTSYTDPQGGGAWTPALLDTMQAGINVTDATPNLFVSTIWALVEYVPVVGGSVVKDVIASGIIAFPR